MTLFTIGHGSRDLPGIIDQLQKAGVTLLVDVRTFPRSRWSAQFNKTALEAPRALGTIRYKHMPELGGYNVDKTLRTKDTKWRNGIASIVFECKRQSVALMCMETDYTKCHRHQTIEPDLLALAPDLKIVHLPPPERAPRGSNRQLSFEPSLPRSGGVPRGRRHF